MALTRAKLEELIAAGEIEVGGGGVNPNLLHNCDFRNPVNQRGVSGAISTGAYFYDRWIRNSGTVTVNAGYLTLASGAVIEQRIEGVYLAGETVCVSVKVGASVYSGSGTFPTSTGTASITLTGFGTAKLGYNAGYMYVLFTASGAKNVVMVKCELGTVSTLHLDPPADYGVELAKCQRFLYRVPNGYIPLAYSNSSSLLYLFFQTPAEMRILPSVIYEPGSSFVLRYIGTTSTISWSDVIDVSKYGMGIRLAISGSYTRFQAAGGYITGAPIFFSAEF
jgi:hypothetical protein